MSAPTARGILLRALPPLVAYLLLAQLGAALDRPLLIAAAMPIALALLLFPALRRASIGAWATLAVVALAEIALLRSGLTTLPSLLLPILADFAVAIVFAATLRRGSTPLIARFIAAVDGAAFLDDPAVRRYARRLTATWAIWMTLLGSIALVLGACAMPGGFFALAGRAPPIAVAPSTWSAWANVGNYVAIGALFAIEFAGRTRWLPQAPRHTFGTFLARIVAHWRSVVGIERAPTQPQER